MNWWEVLIRIFISMVIGGIVGIQREFKNSSAGLRTHVLVAVGACVAMLTNEFLFLEHIDKSNMDIARMGSYVISGIGFLGAGSIIKDGMRIRGLTTAAGLWVVACLGVAVGAGAYLISLSGVFIVIFVIIVLKLVENSIFTSRKRLKIELEIANEVGNLAKSVAVISDCGLKIKDIQMNEYDDERIGVLIITSGNFDGAEEKIIKALGNENIKFVEISAY